MTTREIQSVLAGADQRRANRSALRAHPLGPHVTIEPDDIIALLPGANA